MRTPVSPKKAAAPTTSAAASALPVAEQARRAQAEPLIAENRVNFDVFDSSSPGDVVLEMIPFVASACYKEPECAGVVRTPRPAWPRP